MTVDPTTVRPDSSAAFATALAKSASAKKEPSLELRALDLLLLQFVSLLSVTLAHDASIEPKGVKLTFYLLCIYHYVMEYIYMVVGR